MTRYLVVAGVALAVAGLDQYTKYLAVRDLTTLFERARVTTTGERVSLYFTEERIQHLARPEVPIVPGFWTHRYAENPGASFNLLRTARPAFRRVFFTAVFLLAVGFIGVMTRRLPRRRWGMGIALGAILGGAIGNFVDRITRGYVVDFIDWHAGASTRLHWPTFNLADVGITVGAAVLLLHLAIEAFRRER